MPPQGSEQFKYLVSFIQQAKSHPGSGADSVCDGAVVLRGVEMQFSACIWNVDKPALRAFKPFSLLGGAQFRACAFGWRAGAKLSAGLLARAR